VSAGTINFLKGASDNSLERQSTLPNNDNFPVKTPSISH
jgi:hypothetical protein